MDGKQAQVEREETATPRIVSEVRTRFAHIMELEAEEIDMDARLDDHYGVTSMKSMRLVSELEIELGVDIPEEEIEKMATLNDVVRLCETYGPQSGGAKAGGS